MSMFVPRFQLPEYRILLSEFKGHHRTAMSKIDQLAPQLDLVLEVRDARAPVSTRNVLLNTALKDKAKLVLYTRRDLAPSDPAMLQRWHDTGEKFMLIDPRQTKDASVVVRYMQQYYLAMSPPPPLGLRAIVVGLPNLGKSTLVNSLRAAGMHTTRKAARTGHEAGITRATSEIMRVSVDPPVLLYDTPGVMPPSLGGASSMLPLSLTGSINADSVDPVIRADYLLFALNLQRPQAYNTYSQPTNDIDVLLARISRATGNSIKNEKGAAITFIEKFQKGEFGRIFLDKECIFNKYSFSYAEADAKEVNRLTSSSASGKKKGASGKKKGDHTKSTKRHRADIVARKTNMLFKL